MSPTFSINILKKLPPKLFNQLGLVMFFVLIHVLLSFIVQSTLVYFKYSRDVVYMINDVSSFGNKSFIQKTKHCLLICFPTKEMSFVVVPTQSFHCLILTTCRLACPNMLPNSLSQLSVELILQFPINTN